MGNSPIKDFQSLLSRARSLSGVVVGVPCPEDATSIETVIEAQRQGIADFILCGDREKIQTMLADHGGDRNNFEILSVGEGDGTREESAAAKIVDLANENKVHVIMKGFVPTAALMKPILDKETGLRTGKLLSDILIVENPNENYEGFLGMTDGGLNILPDLFQKRQIIENAVAVFHRLGYSKPKVGLLTAIEKVTEAMPATVDAQKLSEMNRNGEIVGCDVFGPLALDIAVSPQAAKKKGIDHPVAGYVQIMVVPNIESGNIFGKSFMFFMYIPVAHVVMGARIPILIPSRNETSENKLYSVALGAVVAKI